MAEAFAFTADEERLLACLLDVIIPPSSEPCLSGAGTLGLTPRIARIVEETPMVRPVIEYGLGALADLAKKRQPSGFAALSDQEMKDVWEEFAATDQFFQPAFLFLVYSSYYQDARVVEALGLEARPPHPKGYLMEADDPSLLDPVRERAKMYREPEPAQEARYSGKVK
jgi:hypothetical protein